MKLIVDTDPIIDMEKAPKDIDIIVAGDVCYQQAMSAKIMRWLWLCVAKGIRVILADPGRAYVPQEGLREVAHYTVPTSRDLRSRKAADGYCVGIGGGYRIIYCGRMESRRYFIMSCPP